MIVDRSVDYVLLDEWRDDNRRNSYTELVEPKVIEDIVFIAYAVAWRRHRWRTDMIVEAAVFVIGDQQKAFVPVRRIANCLVDRFDQALTRVMSSSGCCELPHVKSSAVGGRSFP